MSQKKNSGGGRARDRRRMILVSAAAVCIVAVCLILTFYARSLPPREVPAAYGTVLSLLPPAIAIALALITKEVYSSLFVGIAVGAMLYAGGDVEIALKTLLYHESAGLVSNLTDVSHASILVFVTLLGTIVVLMNLSGGAEAFGNWASKHIRNRVGAELATVFMGLLIFVDDGFNCMTVGSVMRPLTDKHKVSRAKLAYLLDSTAAPICIIAPISCWAAAVSYAVPEDYPVNGFNMFLRAIPYNLYALGTIVMLFSLILLRVDFGPMKLHEDNALKGDLFTSGSTNYEEKTERTTDNVRLSNLVIPVVSLILLCIVGIAYTGGAFSGAGLIDAFANADSATGLVMGSLIAVLLTLWLYMARGVMTLKDFMAAFAAGFRSMCAPMIILILSWNLSGITGLLGAPEFIHGIVEASAGSVQMFVPVIVFLVSVFLAFSTGTSWGTFSILIPIVCAVFPADSEMLVISISACLAGSVCGDHCSPISDTTIMSSAGAHCDHINHVNTQLPYAITVAAVCGAGYLLAGIIGFRTGTRAALAATPLTLLGIIVVVLFFRRRNRRAGAA